MIHKILPLLLFAFSSHPLYAQLSIKEYVKQNLTAVNSAEPDSTDFSDLENIGAAIGGKRLVLLGEQSHGDAATFLAKTRIIKYLHEKKGFNVLAFESDFFSLNEGWDKIPKNKTAIDSFVLGNVFPIWTYCHTTDKLFYSYLYQTQLSPNPLQLSGMDCQIHGAYAWQNLKTWWNGIIETISSIPALQNDAANLAGYSDSLYISRIPADTNSQNRIINSLTHLLEYNSRETVFDSKQTQYLRSCLAEVQSKKGNATNFPYKYYYRDRQMAENIRWLLQTKYKNEKIIIWAHNAHIGKNNGPAGAAASESGFMMGDFLNADPLVKNEMYVLGVTSFKGKTNWTTTHNYYNKKIPSPASGSFERWVPESLDYAFVDFTGYNRQWTGKPEAFSMKGSLAHIQHRNYVMAWTTIFDGIFFIRHMYGCSDDYKPLKK